MGVKVDPSEARVFSREQWLSYHHKNIQELCECLIALANTAQRWGRLRKETLSDESLRFDLTVALILWVRKLNRYHESRQLQWLDQALRRARWTIRRDSTIATLSGKPAGHMHEAVVNVARGVIYAFADRMWFAGCLKEDPECAASWPDVLEQTQGAIRSRGGPVTQEEVYRVKPSKVTCEIWDSVAPVLAEVLDEEELLKAQAELTHEAEWVRDYLRQRSENQDGGSASEETVGTGAARPRRQGNGLATVENLRAVAAVGETEPGFSWVRTADRVLWTAYSEGLLQSDGLLSNAAARYIHGAVEQNGEAVEDGRGFAEYLISALAPSGGWTIHVPALDDAAARQWFCRGLRVLAGRLAEPTEVTPRGGEAAGKPDKPDTGPDKRKKSRRSPPRPMTTEAADCARQYREAKKRGEKPVMASIIGDYVAEHGGSKATIERTLSDHPGEWKEYRPQTRQPDNGV